jgi:hypothetical protein
MLLSRVKSLGSALDDVGFQPLGHRIAIESVRNEERHREHSATSIVHYERSTGRIVIEFNNGSVLMIPARSLEGPVDALEDDIADVELVGGTGLLWERLVVHHRIAALVAGTFGTPQFIAGQYR